MKDYPRLYGGTFYLILTGAMKPGPSNSEIHEGVKKKYRIMDLLKGLLRLVNPSFNEIDENTFATQSAKYKAGNLSNGDSWPLEDSDLLDAYDKKVRSNYSSALFDMHKYVDTYLRSDLDPKMNALINRLFALVNDDETLKNVHFYTREDGQPESREDLLKRNDICLDSLLLGLWHYILINRPENSCQDTYTYWAPDIPNGRRQVLWYRIETWKQDIKWHRAYLHADNKGNDISSDENTKKEAQPHDTAEPIYVEVISDEDQTGSSDQGEKKYEQNATIYNNYGNGTTIGTLNAGTINIGGAKDD